MKAWVAGRELASLLGREAVGVVAATLHACLLIAAIAMMSPPNPGLGDFLDSGGGSTATIYAGRPFHLVYETLLLKLLFLADLPFTLTGRLTAWIVLLPLLETTDNFRIGTYAWSYVHAAMDLCMGSFQWFLIGVLIQRRICHNDRGRRFCQAVKSWLFPTIVICSVITMLTVPILNQRSAALGFRHPGISFVGPGH